jgi:hypothetical protein
LNLALLSEDAQRQEEIKRAHEERIELGANEFNSRRLMEQELTQIASEQEDLRNQKRMESMQNVLTGFQEASTILGNINQMQVNSVNENFDKRQEAIENQFGREIHLAEGSAEAQERIRADRDEKLRQLDLKRNREVAQARKQGAGLRKGVAIGEAVMNGALAVTRAWAEGGSFCGSYFSGISFSGHGYSSWINHSAKVF